MRRIDCRVLRRETQTIKKSMKCLISPRNVQIGCAWNQLVADRAVTECDLSRARTTAAHRASARVRSSFGTPCLGPLTEGIREVDDYGSTDWRCHHDDRIQQSSRTDRRS